MEQPSERIGVVALVGHEWSEPWSTPHQVIGRLASRCPVVWVDPPCHLDDVPGRLRGRDLGGLVPVAKDRLWVYRPEPWRPRLFRPPALARWLSRKRGAKAIRRLRAAGCERIAVYVWRPQFGDALEWGVQGASFYHIDDEYTFSTRDEPIRPEELELLKAVDGVFISSPAMMEKKGHVNPDTFLVPNGVDFHLYARDHPEPDDLAGIPPPRIGYTGMLKKQLDWELLETLARRNPDWSFVLVGPLREQREVVEAHRRLRELSNVYFLGEKPVATLAAYPGHFDVCMMPYRVDGYTQYISPLKLHEYLASGTPTVGARIRTLQDFAHVLALPGTTEEWDRAIRVALSPEERAEDRRSARRSVARSYDWERAVDVVYREMVRLTARPGSRTEADPAVPSSAGGTGEPMPR